MSGAHPVTDFLSNVNDQVANGAKLLGRSAQRQRIFNAVYKGQKQEKSVAEIMRMTGLSQINVLNGGMKLRPLMDKVKGGFRKKKDLAPHYKKILTLSRSPSKLAALPTKVSPKVKSSGAHVTVRFPNMADKAKLITIDEIDSFSDAPKRALRLGRVREDSIKDAFAAIFGDGGTFKDWGGERSDLYTTKCRVHGARRAIAIAFKGQGTSGKLVPAKMGKNGDQIGRLFDEPAEVFLVVYCGQIDSSIVSQMQAFAIAKKAMNGQRAYFGIVDADDLGRIAAGYPQEFNPL